MPTIVECVCCQCGRIFERPLRQMPWNKGRKTNNTLCSRECLDRYNTTAITLPCGECGQSVTRNRAEHIRSKSGHLFCNRSCSASYNNKHKTHGTRRSKLEVYIEEQLREDFPSLELECNSKSAIESKLDFYFPELKFAIELNGIFHYEPIYGKDKLERIQQNDKQKVLRCAENGIELCIVDSSQCKYLTKKAKAKYYGIVRDLVTSISKRAE